jgi:lipoprotein-anchoring transpeptidase ErfK/SrfK
MLRAMMTSPHLPVALSRQIAVLRRDRAFRDDWRTIRARFHTGDNADFIAVDVARQRLYLFRDGHRADAWTISTALRGIGERMNSYRTPIGAFRIARKIGAGLRPDAVLRYQAATGATARPVYATDDPAASKLILARILWLEGLQPGWNEGGSVDTYSRHIYIHGTANIGMLGRPASYGCVQMAPRAVIELYRDVPPGTPVLITPGTGNLRHIPGLAAPPAPAERISSAQSPDMRTDAAFSAATSFTGNPQTLSRHTKAAGASEILPYAGWSVGSEALLPTGRTTTAGSNEASAARWSASNRGSAGSPVITTLVAPSSSAAAPRNVG